MVARFGSGIFPYRRRSAHKIVKHRQLFMAATRLDLSRKLRIFLRGSSPAYLGWFLIGGILLLPEFYYNYPALPACKDFALGRHTGRSRDCLLDLNGPVSLPKYRLPYEPVLIILQALGC